MCFKFVNGVFGGLWEMLMQGRVDIIVGVMCVLLFDIGFGFVRLGDFELVFVVVLYYLLVYEEELFSCQMIKCFCVIVVGDSVYFL